MNVLVVKEMEFPHLNVTKYYENKIHNMKFSCLNMLCTQFLPWRI